MLQVITLPNVKPARIHSDIKLQLPKNISIDPSQWHHLVYIPWEDKFFNGIPSEYLDFFNFVLPNLKVRTTDVHTAKSLSFLAEFQEYFASEEINWRVVAISLILHDCGWSLLTQQEIASSLGVKGLKLSPEALDPKLTHVIKGQELARRILDEYEFEPALTDKEKDTILKSVLYHDRPEQVAGLNLSIEVKVLVDLDHIWSFTHENFWQNIVRKEVEPETYLQNLKDNLDSYFTTDFGKELAAKLLSYRAKEISGII
ncbi:MAG: hypothetical protein GW941_00390 [Candidatus Pacebacteria bacterium]|nr:hypothetical protein [Candidatus Paceibacterota bacterium]